jgi:predicted RNA-binding protein YlxR (DUF448 family)
MKRLPARTCRGCHQIFEKNKLLRIVKTPEGLIALDDCDGLKSASLPGRGVYVCRKKACIMKMIPKKSGGTSPLSHFLKSSVSRDFFAMLEQYCHEHFSSTTGYSDRDSTGGRHA